MKRAFIVILFLTSLAMDAFAQPRQLSVRDFLRLSQKDTANYIVKGVVDRVRSTTRGSFYLKDNTGMLLVYGIRDPRDLSRSFTQMDIVKGDTVTVMGRFTIYNGTTLEMKDGRLVSKADGPDHDLSFYDRLEKKPSFRGKEGEEGLEAFRKWVQDHLKAPAGGEKGTVRVRFVIGRNGGVQEVQVTQGVSPALNAEAERVVKSAPKWKPAKSDGSQVRITYTIPVVFE
jgi:TonB family protein